MNQLDLQNEVTPAMIEVGVDRFSELMEAGSGAAYVVEQVFLSMYLSAPELVRHRGQACN
jgi:hypothetical protein